MAGLGVGLNLGQRLWVWFSPYCPWSESLLWTETPPESPPSDSSKHQGPEERKEKRTNERKKTHSMLTAVMHPDSSAILLNAGVDVSHLQGIILQQSQKLLMGQVDV